MAALVGMASLVASGTPSAAFTPAEGKAAMTVTLVRSDAKDCGTDCPEWIALTGKILPQTPTLLKAIIGRIGNKHLPILVDSPGGAVEAALAMGRMIRAHKLDVAVAGTALTDCAPGDRACLLRARGGERPGYVAAGIAACASACVFVLAAGKDRFVGHDSYVGVHQMTASRTVTRVINTFRILRRMVNGHVVEVSRTLVATRPVSSHVVTSAAPVQTYSEVDRYLLGMGIDESIMPLMHATPPSGIHWMTPAELTATRIATDTTDAQTLVEREGEPAVLAKIPVADTGLSALTLDDGRRWLGAATWRIEPSAQNAPRLVVDIAIPERRLTGTLTIARSTDPAVAAAYTGVVGFVPVEAGAAIREMRAAQFCDRATCLMPMRPDPSFSTVDGPFTFNVPIAWGDTFLSSLRGRDWLDLPVRTADGWGKVTVPLTGASSTVIGAWEHLCCGLALPTEPRPAPNPPLPAPPVTPAVSPQTVRPPAPSTFDDRFSSHFTFSPQGAAPIEGSSAVAWISLGSGALLGTLTAEQLGLRMSMQVTSGGSADATIEFNIVPSLDRFGPLASMRIPPVWGPNSHVVVLAEAVDRFRYGGGYRASLRLSDDDCAGSDIKIEMTDVTGRRLTVSLPIEGPLRDLLRAARERRAAKAS